MKNFLTGLFLVLVVAASLHGARGGSCPSGTIHACISSSSRSSLSRRSLPDDTVVSPGFVFHAIDKNKDNKLDVIEWMDAGNTIKEYAHLLQIADVNGDEVIESNESMKLHVSYIKNEAN